MTAHSIYIGIPAIALCCFLFLFFCFMNTKKTTAVLYFRITIMDCILWCTSVLLMRLQVQPGVVFWHNMSLFGLLLLPVCIYRFLYLMLDIKNRMILYLSELAAIVLTLLNTFTGIILPPPTISTVQNGFAVLAYDTGVGVYTLLSLEVMFLIYVTVQAHFRIGEDMYLRRKLIPLLIGTLFVLVGNILTLFPGATFPYDTLGAVGMAICLVYIMYKQYMFNISFRLLAGATYTLACALAVLPAFELVDNLEKHIGAMTTETKHVVLALILLQSAWSVALVYLARRQVYYIMGKMKRNMMEHLEDFQSVTVSLVSKSELFDKIRSTVQGIFKDSNVVIYDGDFSEGHVTDDCWNCESQLGLLERQEILREAREKQGDANPELVLLKYDNEVKGFIKVLLPDGYKMNYEEADCLRQIGVGVSGCLKNIYTYDTVYQMSIHDELTGLYNRTYCKEFLVEHGELTEPCGIIHMDMDNFKLFNELHGESVGDEVLRWSAEKIKRVLDKRAIAFRTASNEFLVYVPKASKSFVYDLAKEMRNAIAAGDSRKPKVMQPITFSMGIGCFPGTATTLLELHREAELASYYGKRNGRDRIEIYERRLEDIEESLEGNYDQIANTVYALMAAIDVKDSYTFVHSCHVSETAVLVARRLGLSQSEVQIMKEAGLLHDIGKIGITDNILMKKARLTNDEYEVMKTHVENSIEMIHFLPNMNYVIPAVVSHHERFDGKGYPRGLAGEEIPLLGRILAICDSFDAMVSKRVYSDPMTVAEAIEELEKNRGTQFDPMLVDIFIQLIREGKIAV